MYVFRPFRKKSLRQDFMAALFAVIAAIIASYILFLCLNFAGLVPGSSVGSSSGPLRGAALERVLYEPVSDVGTDVSVEVRGSRASFGGIGQENVDFMSFELSPNEESSVKKLIFSFDGFAKPSDLVSLQ